MRFYSVRHRRAVEVPDETVEGRVIERTTRAGARQVRYLLTATAEVEGQPARLTKFVSRAEFEAVTGGRK
jgi:hypothetical protein